MYHHHRNRYFQFHKLVAIVLKTFYKKPRPRTVHYRNMKNEKDNFSETLILKLDTKNVLLSKINDTVLYVLGKHPPRSMKRSKNFMTKELRKTIINRSKVRKKVFHKETFILGNSNITISKNKKVADIFNKHFSKHVETLHVDKTLAKNIVSSNITDPLMLKLCF